MGDFFPTLLFAHFLLLFVSATASNVVYVSVGGASSLPCGTSPVSPCGSPAIALNELRSRSSIGKALGSIILATGQYDAPFGLFISGGEDVEIQGSGSTIYASTILLRTSLIQVDNANITLSDLTLSATTHDNNGGCLSVTAGPAYAIVNNTSFVNCSAHSYTLDAHGGAVSLSSAGVVAMFSQTTFEICYASDGAGAFSVHDGAVATIVDSSFTFNAVGSSAPGGAGAVCIYGYSKATSLTVRRTLFESNVGSSGGAIFHGVGVVDIADSQFLGNLGFNGANFGGAISVLPQGTGTPTSDVTMFVRNSVFNANSAQVGGAISVEYGTLYTESCNFANNFAEGNGGAISGIFAQVFVSNSIFSGNTAVNGGALMMMGGIFNMNSSTVLLNMAAQGGGLFLSPPLQSSILDCLVSDNIANGTSTLGTAMPYQGTCGGGISILANPPAPVLPIQVEISNTRVLNNKAMCVPPAVTHGAAGGGVCILVDVQVNPSFFTMTNCSISGNQVVSFFSRGAAQGGGLHAGVNIIPGATPPQNTSSLPVWDYTSGAVVLTDTTIANNTVFGGPTQALGGGASVERDCDAFTVPFPTLMMIRGSIVGNTIEVGSSTLLQSGGGGLASSNGAATLNGTRVEKNAAHAFHQGQSAQGGGVLIQASQCGNLFEPPTLLDHAIISNNYVIATINGGGGVSVLQGDAMIMNSLISNNQVMGVGTGESSGLSSYGGGVYVSGGVLDVFGYPSLSYVRVQNCQISSNTAGLSSLSGRGGGLYSTMSSLLVNGTTFAFNTVSKSNEVASCAGTFGGGVLVEADIMGPVLFTDCTITGNYAASAGGGLGILGATPFAGGTSSPSSSSRRKNLQAEAFSRSKHVYSSTSSSPGIQRKSQLRFRSTPEYEMYLQESNRMREESLQRRLALQKTEATMSTNVLRGHLAAPSSSSTLRRIAPTPAPAPAPPPQPPFNPFPVAANFLRVVFSRNNVGTKRVSGGEASAGGGVAVAAADSLSGALQRAKLWPPLIVTFDECDFKENTAGSPQVAGAGGGLAVIGAYSVMSRGSVMRNVVVGGNSSVALGGGIMLYASTAEVSSVAIAGNEVVGLGAYGAGIAALEESGANFTGSLCQLANNFGANTDSSATGEPQKQIYTDAVSDVGIISTCTLTMSCSLRPICGICQENSTCAWNVGLAQCVDDPNHNIFNPNACCPSSCSGQGSCTDGVCTCNFWHGGDACSKLSVAGVVVLASIVLVVGTIAAAIAASIFRRRARAEMTLELREKLLSDFVSIPVLDVTLRHAEVIPFTDILLGNKIGSGTSGSVYKAVWKNSVVAVKRVHSALDETSLQSIRHEVDAMANLRHPNVLAFLGTCYEPPELYIVVEFCPLGDLRNFLDKNPEIDLVTRYKLALDCASGLAFIHSRNMLHRDIKSPNLLLTRSRTLVIADLGFSVLMDAPLSGSLVGTPAWIAPEVFKSRSYTAASDVYAFGVVLWEIFSNLYPFADLVDTRFLTLAIAEGNVRLHHPPTMHAAASTLSRRCCEPSPLMRPNMEEVVATLQIDLNSLPRSLLGRFSFASRLTTAQQHSSST